MHALNDAACDVEFLNIHTLMLQVSTPQIEDAALYVERRAKELQDLAKDTRLDLMVEVCITSTPPLLRRLNVVSFRILHLNAFEHIQYPIQNWNFQYKQIL